MNIFYKQGNYISYWAENSSILFTCNCSAIVYLLFLVVSLHHLFIAMMIPQTSFYELILENGIILNTLMQ